MKVPVYMGVKKIEFKNKPKPDIHFGEVLVRIEYCGICGGDVHSYLGDMMLPTGTVIGHEASGRVVEVGGGVPNLKSGDRVAVKPISE